jgi:hypothetical protein
MGELWPMRQEQANPTRKGGDQAVFTESGVQIDSSVVLLVVFSPVSLTWANVGRRLSTSVEGSLGRPVPAWFP